MKILTNKLVGSKWDGYKLIRADDPSEVYLVYVDEAPFVVQRCDSAVGCRNAEHCLFDTSSYPVMRMGGEPKLYGYLKLCVYSARSKGPNDWRLYEPDGLVRIIWDRNENTNI